MWDVPYQSNSGVIVLADEDRAALLERVGIRQHSEAVLEARGEEDGVVRGRGVEQPQQPVLRVRDVLVERILRGRRQRRRSQARPLC